jgi:hypothetical protein
MVTGSVHRGLPSPARRPASGTCETPMSSGDSRGRAALTLMLPLAALSPVLRRGDSDSRRDSARASWHDGSGTGPAFGCGSRRPDDAGMSKRGQTQQADSSRRQTRTTKSDCQAEVAKNAKMSWQTAVEREKIAIRSSRATLTARFRVHYVGAEAAMPRPDGRKKASPRSGARFCDLSLGVRKALEHHVRRVRGVLGREEHRGEVPRSSVRCDHRHSLARPQRGRDLQRRERDRPA